MKTIFSGLIAATLVTVSASAHAAMIVRVSGKGADAAGCGTVAAPCRTLQFAHDQVDAGGYIVAVDPADFGQLKMTKPVNLANESAGAAVATTPTPYEGAICLYTTNADVIRLRGFTVEARQTGSSGVIVNGAKRLEVDSLDIRYTANGGVFMNLSSASSLVFRNTSIAGNGVGIQASLRSGVYATGLRLINNRTGIAFNNSSFGFSPVVVKDSFVATDPAHASTAGMGVSVSELVNVLRTVTVSGFPKAIDSRALVLLSRSTLTGNTAVTSGGTQSAGDNVIRGNTDDTLGLITPAALH